jgi:hypothetical protein
MSTVGILVKRQAGHARVSHAAFLIDISYFDDKERGQNKFPKQAHRFGSNLFDLKLQKLME